MQRHFIQPDFKVTDWNSLKIYFDELLKREIHSVNELEKWLKDISELGAVVSEDMGWRYIKMTCDTNNQMLRDRYKDRKSTRLNSSHSQQSRMPSSA